MDLRKKKKNQTTNNEVVVLAAAIKAMDERVLVEGLVASTNSISPQARKGLRECLARLKKGKRFYMREARKLQSEPIEEIRQELRAAGIDPDALVKQIKRRFRN